MKKFSLKIKDLLFGFLILLTLPAFSVFPEMEIWSDGTNFRYLMKDKHADYLDGRVSIKQQADIIWAANLLKDHGVFVLAEDSYNYFGINKKIHHAFCPPYSAQTLQEEIISRQQIFQINTKQAAGSMQISPNSPLTCLTRACQIAGIKVYNTECNHGRIVFFKNYILPITQRISSSEIIADLSTHLDEIKKTPLCKEMHTQLIGQFNEFKKTADELAQYEHVFTAKFSAIREKLVDAKTVHKLSEWNNIKHGFICEGNWHIENIKKGLTALKYTQIKSIGVTDVLLAKKTDQTALHNALDIKQVFIHFFSNQKILSSKDQLTFDALKNFAIDPTFLSSSHGQKYLAETAVKDTSQTAAAPAYGAAQASVATPIKQVL